MDSITLKHFILALIWSSQTGVTSWDAWGSALIWALVYFFVVLPVFIRSPDRHWPWGGHTLASYLSAVVVLLGILVYQGSEKLEQAAGEQSDQLKAMDSGQTGRRLDKPMWRKTASFGKYTAINVDTVAEEQAILQEQAESARQSLAAQDPLHSWGIIAEMPEGKLLASASQSFPYELKANNPEAQKLFDALAEECGKQFVAAVRPSASRVGRFVTVVGLVSLGALLMRIFWQKPRDSK